MDVPFFLALSYPTLSLFLLPETAPLFDCQVMTGDNVGIVRGLTAHTAAATGDLEILIAIASKDIELVRVSDRNGWTPLHEAVRGGHLECVKFLIRSGLDKVSPFTARELRTLFGL